MLCRAKAVWREGKERRQQETARVIRCLQELDLIDSWLRRIQCHRTPARRSNQPAVPPYSLHIPQPVLQLVQEPHSAAVAARVTQVEAAILQRGQQPDSYRTQDPGEHAAFLQQLAEEELTALEAALKRRATGLQAGAGLTSWLPNNKSSCSACSRRQPLRPAACSCADRLTIGRTLTATPGPAFAASSDPERRRVWIELAAADNLVDALEALREQLLKDAGTLQAELSDRTQRDRVPAVSLLLDVWKAQQS